MRGIRPPRETTMIKPACRLLCLAALLALAACAGTQGNTQQVDARPTQGATMATPF
jgi:hypothetical protein